jgi:hypothetical protein
MLLPEDWRAFIELLNSNGVEYPGRWLLREFRARLRNELG